MISKRAWHLAALTLLLLAGCSSSDSEATEAFAVAVFEDPAAFDEILAEAQARKQPDEVVVVADIEACAINSITATPQPELVKITVELDLDIACATSFDFRAVFLLDAQGENSSGAWDYTDGVPDLVAITR